MHGLIFNVTQNPYISRALGGHRIASYLREYGWDIEIVDWANWWSLEQLKELFRSRYSNKTVFAGFGHLFSMWDPMLEEFCQWIKTNYPHVVIISGSSVNPSFQSHYIDYYIQGFGEHAIRVLLKYITSNGPAPVFNLACAGGRKIIPAIHNYPAFPMSSLMTRYEDRDFIEPSEWLTIEFSRGCMFSCDFCNFPVLGVKNDHTRDADDFEANIKDIYNRFGVKHFIAADETFNDRTSKISKFANVVERLDFTPWFSGYIRADLLTTRPQDCDELLRMNFLGHFYGIESFNQASAKAVGKGMNTERLQQGLIDTKQYFKTHGRNLYRGSCSLIIGLPHETKDSINNTVNWLIDNWQGESFSCHKLLIPADDGLSVQSKMTSNLSKYGYEPMTDTEIDQCESRTPESKKIGIGLFDPKSKLRDNASTEIKWKSSIMNIYDAEKLELDILMTKQNYDFRPSCYGLSYRLTEAITIEEKLALGYNEFDSQCNFSIDSYINKKLGL